MTAQKNYDSDAWVKVLAFPWQQLTGSLSICSPQTLRLEVLDDYDHHHDVDNDDGDDDQDHDLVDSGFLLPLLLS